MTQPWENDTPDIISALNHEEAPAHGSGPNHETGTCPFTSGILKQTAGGGTRNRDWWPNQLKDEHPAPALPPLGPDGRVV